MIRQVCAVILTVLLLFSAPVHAQDAPTGVDYDAWEQVAEVSEALVGEPDSSRKALSDARARVVEWRAQLQDAQNVNSPLIDRLRQQIEALGPQPAEGATEDEEVAARRADLKAELAAAQAPRLAAVEALSRANAIVESIDRETRQRQAVELARMSPSPLIPANWSLAAAAAAGLLSNLVTEGGPRWTDPQQWAALQTRLPTVIGFLAAAILLLTFGRSWVNSLPSRLSERASSYSRAVLAFLTSLGQIVIPMMGIYLAIRAVRASGLPGPWTTPFVESLPVAGVILFGGTWLARQLFPRRAIAYASLVMTERSRNAARRLANGLSVIFAIHHILSRAVLPASGMYDRMGDAPERVPLDIAEGAASVWHFALILAAALALFRLGHVLRRLTRGEETTGLSYRHRILAWAGLLTRIVAVVGVLATAAGFVNFGNLLIWPWALSLAMIGLLILLQDFIADLFDMMSRGQEGARDGLGPLLISFALVLLSVPLFMVIWGARATDLAEYWTRFQAGVSLGGITLSPGSVLTFVVVFAIGYMLTRGVQGAFRSSILPKTRMDAGGQNAIVSGLGYVGVVIAALLAVTSAGIDLSSLAIVAGALSVGIGFGLQNIVSNFVSGIILLIERPVSVGDWISAGGQEGIVKRISVRSTQVETFDKTEVIVPNSDLISQPVVNWTRHDRIGRIIIPVGVAYGTDTRRVERILREIIEDQAIVTIDPKPAVLFRGFGADSMDFEIRAVLSDVTAGLGTTSEVCHQIAERFKAEGIEIPFAQRDIWLRNPEALRGAADPADSATDVPEDQPRPRAATRIDDPRLTFDGLEADSGDGDR